MKSAKLKTLPGFVELVCKYRNLLMGFAILWVVFFHSKIEVSNSFLSLIQSTGYAGVDIFMFLSGIGLYYSLRKNTDIISFYQRRIARILPSYIPLFILWFLIGIYFYPVSLFGGFKCFLGNIFMCGWALNLDYQFNWYVQAIFLFYLVTPIFYQYLMSCKHIGKQILLLLVLCILGIPYIGVPTLMAISRLPIFFLGMTITHNIENHLLDLSLYKRFLISIGLLSCILGLIAVYYCYLNYESYCVKYGIYWYPFLLITPFLCYFLSVLFYLLDKVKLLHYLNSLLKKLGECSFEIYLVHILLFNYVPLKFLAIDTNLKWLILSIVSISLGCIYEYLIRCIKKSYKKKEAVA